MRKIKTGILGGTFNPVHKGHVQIALNAKKQFSLDRVLFILSAFPPHKTDDEIPDPELRLRLLNKVLEKYDGLYASDIELKRDKLSWTIDTVRELKKNSDKEDFFFITGSDSFLTIEKWKDYRELLNEVVFFVLIREGRHRGEINAILKRNNLPLLNTSPVSGADPPCCAGFEYTSDIIDISSTEIREKIRSGFNGELNINTEVKKILEESNIYGKK